MKDLKNKENISDSGLNYDGFAKLEWVPTNQQVYEKQFNYFPIDDTEANSQMNPENSPIIEGKNQEKFQKFFSSEF